MEATNDPFWVIELKHLDGYQVVYCTEPAVQGDEKDGNWALIADGLTRREAVAFCARLRGPS